MIQIRIQNLFITNNKLSTSAIRVKHLVTLSLPKEKAKSVLINYVKSPPPRLETINSKLGPNPPKNPKSRQIQ